MDCQRVKLMLPAFQDGCVLESEQKLIHSHLARCGACSQHLGQLDSVRRSIKTVPTRPVPAHLAFALRAAASREAARRRRYAGFGGRLRQFQEAFALFVNNLMRPLAVPAAGGLATAMLLFAVIMPNFQGIIRVHANDVPITFSTEPTVRATLLDAADGEIFVDVLVNDQGRVIDYSFPDGYGSFNTSAMRRKLENSLLFTEFNPGTQFGTPTAGWVRVRFSGRSAIDVKG